MKAHKPSNDNAIEAVKEFLFSYRTAIKEKNHGKKYNVKP